MLRRSATSFVLRRSASSAACTVGASAFVKSGSSSSICAADRSIFPRSSNSSSIISASPLCHTQHRGTFDTQHPMHEQLHGLINKGRIVVFLTGTPMEPQCGFTMRMVDLLEQLPIQYEYVNIMESDAVCEGLKSYSGWPTYPQMYVDGELLGGFDITRQMILDGSLVKLLNSKGLLIKPGQQ